jgi:hypothetical protein
MSGRTRLRAFLLAVLSVLAAALLLAALGRRAQQKPNRSAPQVEQVPLRSGQTSKARAPKRDSQAAASLARREAGREARHFLLAFLRYQAGGLDMRARRRLNAAATVRVRRYLLRAPPRAVAKHAQPELAALHLYRPRRGEIKASATLAYPATATSLFEFALRRRGGVWRVTELYP